MGCLGGRGTAGGSAVPGGGPSINFKKKINSSVSMETICEIKYSRKREKPAYGESKNHHDNRGNACASTWRGLEWVVRWKEFS